MINHFCCLLEKNSSTILCFVSSLLGNIVVNISIIFLLCVFILLLFMNVDPDRIVRIENEQTESSMNLNEEIGVGGRSNSTTLSTDPFTGRHSFLHHVMRKSKKEKKHHPSARRREVLLSKISIYIVYMMVCCHRYVEIQ